MLNECLMESHHGRCSKSFVIQTKQMMKSSLIVTSIMYTHEVVNAANARFSHNT